MVIDNYEATNCCCTRAPWPRQLVCRGPARDHVDLTKARVIQASVSVPPSHVAGHCPWVK